MELLFTAVLVLAQAVAPPAAKLADKPDLQDARFAKDLHDKDIADVLTLYTPDAVFTDPDGTAHKGLAEIRNLYEKVTTTYDSDIHLTRTKIRYTNNVAIEHGAFEETLTTRATGVSQQIKGTFVFLHKRQSDGTWLISVQKWYTSPLH